MSVVITCFSLFVPDEYVVVKVEAQGSEYQGMFSVSVVDETAIVYGKFV
jgi:hypothetical protein